MHYNQITRILAYNVSVLRTTLKPTVLRKIRVPLNAAVSDGVITVVLDLEQPGRVQISKPDL